METIGKMEETMNQPRMSGAVKTLFSALLAAMAVAGCAGDKTPAIPAEATTVPAKEFAFTYDDAIAAAGRLADDLLSDPLFTDCYNARVKQNNQLPMLKVDWIKNHSMLHCDFDLFRNELENRLRKSGRFVIAPDSRETEAIQSDFAFQGNPEIFQRNFDFLLCGKYYNDRDKDPTTHYLAMRLVDMRSGQVVWMCVDKSVEE